MRSSVPLLGAVLVTLATLAPATARAQVGEAERVAARDLFKQGDELQRAGQYEGALDKFQRAEQVIQAPTNVLRIAECQAALGKLVEAAESYRTVVRWSLPPGAPPAFQSAIDQARGELSQVEPRVPRLVVRVAPAGVASEELYIDGTAVPAALLGEPFPLDPGDHKVLVSAPGYASPEQRVSLRERETKTVSVQLRSLATAPGPAPVPAPTTPTTPTTADTPPPPPVYVAPPEGQGGAAPTTERRRSSASLLLGAHVGLTFATGSLPIDQTMVTGAGPTAQMGDVSGLGVAFGLDGGLRFARRFYLGLVLERSAFGAGHNPQQSLGVSSISSSATGAGVVGAFMADPDKPSFYFELGLLGRWYSFSSPDFPTQSYSTAEVMGGVGYWIPLGRWLRVVPLVSGSVGSFALPDTTASSGQGQQGHAFFLIGAKGFYNIDL